jgi:hypothetical protein
MKDMTSPLKESITKLTWFSLLHKTFSQLTVATQEQAGGQFWFELL